jgi:hypothetical protein
MLPETEHRHGVQEDRSRCPNCIVSESAAQMSEFEAAAWGWYWRNASGWAAKMGITAREFGRLRLRGSARDLFLQAMSKIENAIAEASSRDRG